MNIIESEFADKTWKLNLVCDLNNQATFMRTQYE